MRWIRATLCAALALALWTGFAAAEDDAAHAPVRIGVLKYGTVNWELDAMKRAGLDAANGVDVEIVPFAGEDASTVALQAGSVDMIVSDWLWVSRQRATGADFTFVPYSTSVGSLMVPGDSAIADLDDLTGRTIGVAGGPLDKNWLLIQALAQKDHGTDLAAENDIDGAPIYAGAAQQARLGLGQADSEQLEEVLPVFASSSYLRAVVAEVVDPSLPDDAGEATATAAYQTYLSAWEAANPVTTNPLFTEVDFSAPQQRRNELSVAVSDEAVELLTLDPAAVRLEERLPASQRCT